MVRFAVLAILLAALCAAGPAQAAGLNLDGPATATVQQAAATVAAATPTLGGATTSAPAAPADPVVTTAAGAAGAAASSAAGATAGQAVDAVTTARADSAPRATEPATEVQTKTLSTRGGGPARTLRVGRPRVEASGREPVAGPGRPAARDAAVPPSAHVSADLPVPLRVSAGADRDHRPASPGSASAAGGGAAASAAAAGLGAGLALLAGAFCLAGPRLRRKLLIPPGLARPVAFVSLLERPG